MFQLAASSNNFTDQSALSAIKSISDFNPTNTHTGCQLDGPKPKGLFFVIGLGLTCGKRKQTVSALNLSDTGSPGVAFGPIGKGKYHPVYIIYQNLQVVSLEVNKLRGGIPKK